tara:strand:- start:13421 stop:14740 length:1320 start_codon:yes stop_codon:yes gene_type:complete
MKILFTLVILVFYAHAACAKILTATAQSSTSKLARADALKQLAESIQVSVSGSTMVENQLQNNEYTNSLSEQIKTTTDITLLGVELSEQQNETGFVVTARLNTQTSFFSYLQKIQLEYQTIQHLQSELEQTTNESQKLTLAYNSVNKLVAHLKDYLLAGMLADESGPNDWSANLKPNVVLLNKLQNYLFEIKNQTQNNPEIVATLLTLGIEQVGVLNCPIIANSGSRLVATHPLSNALQQKVGKGYNEESASYFLVSVATQLDKDNARITAFLVDKSGAIVQQQQAKFVVKLSDWQPQTPSSHSKLLVTQFSIDNLSEPIADTYTARVNERVSTAINSKQSFKQPSPCLPVHLVENQAIKNYYGVNHMATVNINAKIAHFFLRPDPKEHLFAMANIIYTEVDVQSGEELVRKMAEGKKFPVLDENEAILEAIDIGLKKL